MSADQSIHDLFQKVREHPDFVFGVIFVPDDVPPEKLAEARDRGGKWGEEALCRAGFEYVENIS